MSVNENNLVIELANVSKIYRSYPTPRHRLLEIISGGRKSYSRVTRALDDVSFALKRGDRLGIVGENGSGKSTLLKVLAGVLTPTAGTVKVNGRVSALLELGAGFNPQLPGRENIKQFCMLHGMRREETEQALPDIIQFSELREAVDHPVKTYSSGMTVRLGFACAVYVQPDILIVDEALSVGDAYFQNKCLHKIRSMLEEGVTFIYVTHAADSIRSLCKEGIWLERGRMRLHGASTEVGAAYQSEVFSRMVRGGYETGEYDCKKEMESVDTDIKSSNVGAVDGARKQAFAERVEPLRTGSGEILIDDISIVDDSGSETDSLELDSAVRIRVFFHVVSVPEGKCNIGLGVTDCNGNSLIHFSSFVHNVYASDAAPHIPQMVEFSFHNLLCPGSYGIDAGIGVLSGSLSNNGQYVVESVIDHCSGGARFSVRFPDKEINKNLWGAVHVDYTTKMMSLD